MTRNDDNPDSTSDDSLPGVEPTSSAEDPAAQVEDDEAYELIEESQFEIFARWLNRQQWTALVVFVVGLVLLVIDLPLGLMVVGGALALAGMFPLVTGYYRSPFVTLEGFAARLRGVLSVMLGAGVFWVGLSM